MANTELILEPMRTWRCTVCNIAYSIPVEFDQRRRQDGQNFYCPNGHAQGYHDTEADKQRKRADYLSAQLQVERNSHKWTKDNLAVTERRRAAQKGKNTLIKNRIKRGLCPCCHAKFKDLEGHMTDQHPGYGADA